MAERLLSTKTVHQKNDQNNAHNAKEEGRFPMKGTIQDIETPEFERRLSANLPDFFLQHIWPKFMLLLLLLL